MSLNIIERVAYAIDNDDDDSERNSERIAENYRTADAPTRAIIDLIFIALCGWSLDTILKGQDNTQPLGNLWSIEKGTK